MPAPKRTQDEPQSAPKAPTADSPNEDVGAAEVQSIRDEHRKRGYEGYSPSTIPNSEYTLLTGPDSPSQAEMAEAIAEQRYNDQKGA